MILSITLTLALGYGLIKFALRGNASSPTNTCGNTPPAGQLGSGFGGSKSNSPCSNACDLDHIAPISIGPIIPNIYTCESRPGVHNCHEHNRECSFIIMIQTCRLVWSLQHHMLAIYCPSAVRKIPPHTKALFIMTPMIHIRHRHIFLLELSHIAAHV